MTTRRWMCCIAGCSTIMKRIWRCTPRPSPAHDAALAELDARRVKEGWNLGVLETRSPGDVIVGPRIDGITLAPALQVYLDLLQGSGRARDMAAHLRAERLERA